VGHSGASGRLRHRRKLSGARRKGDPELRTSGTPHFSRVGNPAPVPLNDDSPNAIIGATSKNNVSTMVFIRTPLFGLYANRARVRVTGNSLRPKPPFDACCRPCAREAPRLARSTRRCIVFTLRNLRLFGGSGSGTCVGQRDLETSGAPIRRGVRLASGIFTLRQVTLFGPWWGCEKFLGTIPATFLCK
jgi:hypothetical protein